MSIFVFYFVVLVLVVACAGVFASRFEHPPMKAYLMLAAESVVSLALGVYLFTDVAGEYRLWAYKGLLSVYFWGCFTFLWIAYHIQNRLADKLFYAIFAGEAVSQLLFLVWTGGMYLDAAGQVVFVPMVFSYVVVPGLAVTVGIGQLMLFYRSIEDKQNLSAKASIITVGVLLATFSFPFVVFFAYLDMSQFGGYLQLLPLISALVMPYFAYSVVSYEYMSPSLAYTARAMFSSLKDGVIICDGSDVIRQMNAAAEQILSTRKAVGKPISSVIRRYQKRAESPVFNLSFEDDTGTQRHYVVQQVPMQRSLRLTGKLIIIRDVSEQRRAESELKRAHNQFEEEIDSRILELLALESMENMGKMAGAIAHDFNNLLSAMMGFASAAYHELPEGSPDKNDVEEILSSTREARDLISRMLSFSRQDDATKRQYLLREIINAAVDLVRPVIGGNVLLQVDDSHQDVYVMAKKTDLIQALVNIITNAAQAVGSRGGTLEIDVNNGGVDDAMYQGVQLHDTFRVGIHVRDTGMGMDNETLRLAVEPFFSTRENAAGMGLPTALRIARDHSGGIALRSAPGRGTTVSLYLPALGAVDDTSDDLDEITSSGETILLVDDDERITKAAQTMLRPLGYTVIVYNNPKDALDFVRMSPGIVDLLVTDLDMPQMTGLELTEAALAEKPHLPVIVFSASITDADLEAARQLGVRSLIRKPVEFKKVVGKIRRILDNESRVSYFS